MMMTKLHSSGATSLRDLDLRGTSRAIGSVATGSIPSISCASMFVSPSHMTSNKNKHLALVPRISDNKSSYTHVCSSQLTFLFVTHKNSWSCQFMGKLVWSSQLAAGTRSIVPLSTVSEPMYCPATPTLPSYQGSLFL